MVVIKYCGCTGADIVEAKCGVGKARKDKPTMIIPWYNRLNGAKYQDEKYGTGMRVHNIGHKDKTTTHTCTVCNKNSKQ